MFAVAGPRLWNSLPTAIRNISLTIHTFGKHLKTLFFLVERGRGAFVTFMISLRRIQMFLLTYLLTYNGPLHCGSDVPVKGLSRDQLQR